MVSKRNYPSSHRSRLLAPIMLTASKSWDLLSRRLETAVSAYKPFGVSGAFSLVIAA